MRSTIADVFQKDGVLGFYRGFSALLLREVPANFFYFGGYEGMKNLLRSPQEEEDADLLAWKLIISGGFGGMCLWASIYPIDVLKTKLQVRLFVVKLKQEPYGTNTVVASPVIFQYTVWASSCLYVFAVAKTHG